MQLLNKRAQWQILLTMKGKMDEFKQKRAERRMQRQQERQSRQQERQAIRAQRGPGMVKSFIQSGQVNTQVIGQFARLAFVIGMLIVIAGVIVTFIMVGGVNGIINIFQDVFGGTVDTAKQGADLYTDQVAQAMGLSYASQVDEYADESLGLELRDVELTQQIYEEPDPVTIWGILEGKAFNRPLEAKLDCWHEVRDDKSNGFLTPSDEFLIEGETTTNFKCEFPPGILSNTVGSYNKFFVTSDFDFSTMAYLTATFMDEDAMIALRRSDPERLLSLQTVPTAKNTYGPISLGIGSQEFPIMIQDGSSQIQPYIGFSISNQWQGLIKNISKINILLPKGIELESCDGFTEFRYVEQGSDDFFRNYTMMPEGIEYLSEKITSDDNQFIPQNFKCFMNFDPGILYENRNRLDPIELNIFAFIDYRYQFEKELSASVQPNRDDVSAHVEPGIVGLYSVPTYSVKNNKPLGRLDSAAFTLKHRKPNTIDSIVVDGFEAISISRESKDTFKDQFTKPLNEIVPDLERGDSLLFEFNVMKGNGEEDRALRVIKILNEPPEIVEDSIKFSPSVPTSREPVLCSANIIDNDGEEIEQAIFNFRNINTKQEYNAQGACEKISDTESVCSGQLPETLSNPGDRIECGISVTDGLDFNRRTVKKYVSISLETQPTGDGSDSETEVTPCEDDDGNLGGISDQLGTRSVTKGLDDDGDYVIMEDRCISEFALLEYLCEGPENERRVTSIQ